MSLRPAHRSRFVLWFSVVLILAAFRSSVGAGVPGSGELAIWMFLVFAPPALMMLLFRGAPPPTAAEVIYRTERRPRRRVDDLVTSREVPDAE